MTPDDTPIPNDDPVARAARRGLGGIVGSETPGELSWVAVQSGARRVRRRRLTALAAACAIVLVAAGAALAAGANDDHHVRVAGGSTPSSAAATTTTTTTIPSEGPGPGDVTGTIAITAGSPPTDLQPAIVAEVGSDVTISTTIRNVSNRAIWASSSTVPTQYATVCTGEAPGARSVWWMTNILLNHGDESGRSAPFTPTTAYVGTVTCELDVVSFDQQNRFDTTAGGDDAGATILARVPGVPRVKLQVVPARWKVTTTGGVGPLQLGTSTAVDVVTAAGAPDAKGIGTFAVTGRPDFQALGYDCSAQSAADRISLHPQPNATGPYCRTVFFVNVDTGTLAAFDTTSDKYETANGVSVGTSGADAERREGRTAVNGCFRGIALGDLAANPYEVFIWVVAGQPNATVSSLSAEAASNQVGLMFC
jgi:hypothetical protein